MLHDDIAPEDLPAVGTARQASAGVALVRRITEIDVERGGLGCLFREMPQPDFGIDAQIEVAVVDSSGRQHATGKWLSLQVKTGKSYFKLDDGNSWRLYIRKETVNYWRSHPLPVILILVDDEADQVYWVQGDADHEETKQAFCIQVSKSNRLDATSLHSLKQIAASSSKAASEMPTIEPRMPLVSDSLPPMNTGFVGRKSLLRKLWESRSSDKPFALTQAMAGLGGVGKTQIAIEHCHSHLSWGDYHIIWWIDAEDPTTLRAEYAAMAEPLGIPLPDEADDNQIVSLVRKWLEQNHKWLLVFDNVNDRSELVGYLPRMASGHVIITSRNTRWGTTARTLVVDVFGRTEALKFLMDRFPDDDKTAAQKLATTLGRLPLALAQAAGYMQRTGASFAEYEELFRSCRQKLWQNEKLPEDYNKATVATTWAMNFRQLEQESEAGAVLMKLLAFLAPDDIPKWLIVQGAEYLPEPLASAAADPIRLNEAIAALLHYSLVQPRKEALSVHRLVQAVAMDGVLDEEARNLVEAAIRLVSQASDFDDERSETWAISTLLLPHVAILGEHSRRLVTDPETILGLLSSAGLYALQRADYGSAIAIYSAALSITESHFDPQHPRVANYANMLGRAFEETGEYPRALSQYERALEVFDHTADADSLEVARVHNNIGTTLTGMGRLDEAGKHREKALAAFIAKCGPKDAEVAKIRNAIGMSLLAQHKPGDALAEFREALDIAETLATVDQALLSTYTNNVGYALHELERYDEALHYYERALEIGVRVRGKIHPSVATRMNNIAMVHEHVGRLDAALEFLMDALEIDEIVYEHVKGLHPDVARDLSNIGEVLWERGDIQGARPYLERALDVARKCPAKDRDEIDRISWLLKRLVREMEQS